MFKPFPQHLNLPVSEKEVLDFRKANDVFPKSVTSRNATHLFVFFESPPAANGRPGIHRVIARTMKVFGCRLQAMPACCFIRNLCYILSWCFCYSVMTKA